MDSTLLPFALLCFTSFFTLTNHFIFYIDQPIGNDACLPYHDPWYDG